ncbi:hypothetical protein ACFR97_07770 [Haloplanus litoreus]|uniref:Uncharacterized protein n=1 Tax=Haloplanus litoreus TaxID=767515 RepID=A0ABD5ZV35_9EURY
MCDSGLVDGLLHAETQVRPDDDYEWWHLDGGQYLIEYNESLTTERPLSVSDGGLRLKESARLGAPTSLRPVRPVGGFGPVGVGADQRRGGGPDGEKGQDRKEKEQAQRAHSVADTNHHQFRERHPERCSSVHDRAGVTW